MAEPKAAKHGKKRSPQTDKSIELERGADCASESLLLAVEH
jgi:hypothetical protein